MFNKIPRRLSTWFLLAGLTFAVGVWISCGGSSTSPASTTGSATVILSDPPSCAAPGGPFQNVWVTITQVSANISATASNSDSGWVTLVDLTSNPKQIDLLSLASTTCVLTQLGSTSGLAPGRYQQIRLILLANNAASGPSPNNCGSGNGFNCVVPTGGSPQELLLSSEAQTGIKIPPGQITGGGINIAAGQSVDINIDFHACASILQEGNGQYRLKPVLHAGEVALNGNSISGTVVDQASSSPIAGAIVLLEQADLTGIDRVIRAGTTASDGSFIFCPLPSGNYDVVVAAMTGPTVTYGATISLNVPVGTALTGNNKITLVAASTSGAAPGEITGQVTSAGSGIASAADITLSPLQQVVPTGASTVQVTIPVFGATSQPPTFTTTPTPSSGPACPAGADCYNYSLQVPAAVPQVGTFTSGSITYSPSSAGGAYSLNATSSDCSASSPSDGTVGPIPVTPSPPARPVPSIAFTGCAAP